MTLVIPSLFPGWFWGVNAGIELFCALAAIIISIFGFKSYKLIKDNKMMYFGLGFLFIALNLISHALLNLATNFGFLQTILKSWAKPGVAVLLLIYFFLIIMVMLAYMSFIILYSKTTRLGSVGLFYLLTFIIGSLTFRSYFKINLISAIFAAGIVFYTGRNYLKKKTRNALYILIAFSSITLFHAMFVLEHFHGMFYNIKYFVLLNGFVFFLIALLKVYYGRKKK